jgi:thioredoxin 1
VNDPNAYPSPYQVREARHEASRDPERTSSGSARLPARWLQPPVPHQDVVNLTDANYEAEVGKATVPVLIDFWAETCVPCRMQEPIIEELASDMRGTIKVARCNVFENPKLLETFQVRGVPHLTVLRAGEVILELVGDHSLPQLKQHLRDVGIA